MADTTNITVNKDEKSTIKIEGEIPFAELETHRSAAIKHLGREVEMDGFRKGHVPETALMKHLGEMNVLAEMAERALAHTYPEIIKEHKLDVIGHPQISLTKLAEGNPLGFTAVVAVMPLVELPDYKQIAKEEEKEKEEVSDADLEEAIKNILRQKMAYERLQKKAAAEKEKSADGVADLPTPESEAAKKEKEPITSEEEFNKLPLPELTDEYVKTLGEFETVDAFKEKLREHLTIEKTNELTQKHRAAITDNIVAASTIDLPQVMIDSEINQMFAQMQEDLKRSNLKIDDYLSNIKKTKEDLIKEWTPAAEKRAKLQLVLNKIANEEKVVADPEKVEHEVAHLLEHYKDADKERVRIYVESIMKNEEVMKLLEKQTK